MSTIGVSIAIPDPEGARLQDYRVDLGDDSGRLIPAHVTLSPPLDVEAEAWELVSSHLESVAAAHAPFRVSLHGTGTFRPVSPVVFVNVVQGISQCEQLAAAIRGDLFDVETHFPYHPHVTVAHEVDDALLDRAFTELEEFRCTFEVDRFHLYEHDQTAGWRVSRSFALRG